MPLSGTSSGQSVTIDIDIVVFRKADTVAIILYANVDTAGVQALQSIARAAAAKLS